MVTPAQFAQMGDRLNTRKQREKPCSTARDLWLATKATSQVHLARAPGETEDLLISGCL
jgi:hypothetical protein